MIAIKVYVDKEKKGVLQMNDKEALRVAEILLTYANELRSKGDLRAAMLGSILKNTVEGKCKTNEFDGV